MTKLRPYLAIDIETTGLDTGKSHILQIGWVIDDGVSPRDQLQKGSVIIKEDVIRYGESFALGMNGWLFQEMSKKEPKYPVHSLQSGLARFLEAVVTASELAKKFDEEQGEKKPSKKIQLAGKNVANFDFPIIKNWIEYGRPQHIDEIYRYIGPGNFSEYIDHRFLDCGAVFFEVFGKNPGFDKINKLIEWKDINHDALDDAMNVVVALRYRMGMNF
jgi:oligoribonuclease (3'-5' exoribonuclease)